MSVQDLGISLDTVWMLLAAMLVFFMQPGFALCEAGFTRSKNTANILFKNFVDFMVGSVLFWFVGFGFMFGSDGAGFIGMPNFGDLSFYKNAAGLPTEGFLMFETVFCATSATIVSGAMAERTKFSMYCIYSFFISLIIYPVEGHWTWGGGWLCNADAGSFMMDTFGAAFHVAMNGASAGKKILNLLETPDPVWGDEEADGNEIELQNITFSYDGKRDVLKNVTMRFPENGMTSIVGESGCGKSTVVNILLGAYRPQSGSVTVGGKTLESLMRENYYSRLAVVSCSTYIFSTSVRKNFRLAKEEATDEEMLSALQKVNLADFIRKNGGLDKAISEDAANISGGQKQRLALAVALVADKSIYVFDEATSNIDIESEAIIMSNIKELSKTRSVIVISHRLANVVPSDNIYFMESGKLMEQGSHEELMKRNGGYAKIFAAQKELEEGYVQEAAE